MNDDTRMEITGSRPAAAPGRGQAQLARTAVLQQSFSAATRPHLRLFNVKYSPNLGDGLIAECLERALVTLAAGCDVRSIDLAGRAAYGEALAGRTQIMSSLDRMPKWLRQPLVRPFLMMQAHRKWRPHYASGLKGANGVVIGGGNLISDFDLNFPTKLTLAVTEIERLSLPFVVYATGVTARWTPRGTTMLKEAFSSRLLRKVFVRDHQSKASWDRKLAASSGVEAQVVRDPALLAADFFPRPEIRSRHRPVAGIGVMSHIAIRYHADGAPEPAHLEDWYVGLVRSFVSRGFHPVIFTNGSPEDVSYLAELRPRLIAAGGAAISFPQQRTPMELCAIISNLDVLVAYRLHAVIAAYSYGVPVIGLSWDEKLRSFLASVGRESCLCDVTQMSAQAAAELACRLADEGISEKERRQVLREAWDGVSQLLNAIARPG